MKLQARFVQLPISFDANLLAEEIAAIGEEGWRPHPQQFEGNDFLPLIAANGDPGNENFDAGMRPTKYLERSPYLIDVLASLGASLGRTRLMRLSGHAEVTPHIDTHYYWRDRMRVHVPIVTQPTVSFHCGAETVHMAAGECWIFDTWSLHRVINDATHQRIHLVADTVGGEGMWPLITGGRTPQHKGAWQARAVGKSGTPIEQLQFENFNAPRVMTPWEAKDHIWFVLGETQQNHPAYAPTAQAAMHFLHTWRGLWSTYGEAQSAWPFYRGALTTFVNELRAARAEELLLRTGGLALTSLFSLVIDVALADKARDDGGGERRDAPNVAPAMPAVRPARDLFDRPVFIVNPPRSGSTFLFETLTQAPNLFTVGGESHGIIEGIEALSMPARNWESNHLTAADVTPDIANLLRARFAGNLRDRDGKAPSAFPVRMLEKTPKNSLRVPFLTEVFQGARFIYLYRDAREVLASMMEAWESGRFRTYPTLPGWTNALPWSLLLTPGWRDLVNLPLNKIVAAQWKAATAALLDDLEQIPADRRTVARYDALVADPDVEIRRLCAATQLEWDRKLGKDLPRSAFTVSDPEAGKWRKREAEVMEVLPDLQPLIDRVLRYVEAP
ncbi:MAG: sulfotransferase [Terricaulis sp.]